MNRKIILLPLVLSALVLAGCGETGTSSTSSSEETPTSSETTSSSEETPTSSTTSETSEDSTTSEPTLEFTPISDIVESETAVTTRGQVVAKSRQAVIIHDGTAGLYIFGRDYPGTVNVGDYVEAVGSISSYNGLLQMAWSGTVPATITKVSGQIEGTIPAPTALTAEIANGWTTNALTQADVKAYTWRATAGTAGEYTTLNIDGCEANIEPIYHDFDAIPLETGKTYDVTAYFIGYYKYVSVLVTAAEEVAGEPDPEPDPEPEPLPTPVDTTIAEALTGELSKTTLYKVTGVIEAMKGDKYGNAMLVDPETGDYITVYGNTTTMSAFTVTDGEVSYTNPKDAKTTLADIHDGDKITVLCVYDYFQWTDTHELLCVTTEHAAYDGTVAVTMPTEIANATATASKTEAAWGEDITITVTPGENYAVTSVKVDHGYTTETLTAAPYTFKARCINNVTVELRDASVVSESLTIVADNVPPTYNDEQTFTVDGVVFKSNNLAGSYGNGIQTKIGAFIYNETALPKAIDNIVFTFSEKQTSTASADSVNFGTSVMTEVGEENNLVMFDGENATITVDCDVEGATFFRIDHTLKGMICLESIVINYAA